MSFDWDAAVAYALVSPDTVLSSSHGKPAVPVGHATPGSDRVRALIERARDAAAVMAKVRPRTA